MKKALAFIAILFLAYDNGLTQEIYTTYTKTAYMVPMRDGVKLFTMILSPTNHETPLPFLIRRTPYGADIGGLDGSTLATSSFGGRASLANEGYIFVYQDIRGKHKSGGDFRNKKLVTDRTDEDSTDESTDTYDLIDWLVKNIPNNNGKAGISGISYPGLLTLTGSIDPHPALKAASPQASPGDMFVGDDIYHNGAFRLSYAFESSYWLGSTRAITSFPFPQYDLYEWYLKLGSLKNVNEKYFQNKIQGWNNFVQHPNYDDYWKGESPLRYMQRAEVPMLHVGGFFDQEDLTGPQTIYAHLEKNDSAKTNHLVLGPWNHGQWGAVRADSLGRIAFGSNTAGRFAQLQLEWFNYWLKDKGDGDFDEAYCFQTGSNQWKTYSTWPPKEATKKKLYAHANNTCSFDKPAVAKGEVSYVSDPAKPVPYRQRPIEPTDAPDGGWSSWHVQDQRFVSSRPDVVNFVGDTLTDDMMVTGDITVHLIASTTGTDADFVVKLIDVYPARDKKDIRMSGYELPVAMEVFRGRFRKSFEKPEPLTANTPLEFVIDLHQVNHAFLKGHRLMIQIQSTWFPVIARNPQKYVPNIFEAADSDYVKATQTIYCNGQYSTYIVLPVTK